MAPKRQVSISHFFPSQTSKSSSEAPAKSCNNIVPPKVTASCSNGIDKFQYSRRKNLDRREEKVATPSSEDTSVPSLSIADNDEDTVETSSLNAIEKFQYETHLSDDLYQTRVEESLKKRSANEEVQLNHKSKKARATKLTPLEGQIVELTEKHPDKVLLIQIGYKYKAFGENAKHVSKCLNIMYISASDPRFSYCSFPENRLHINLQRILNSGVKVGIVKQMESAIIKEIDKVGKSGDLIKREVTGVYTKGTYMSDEFIGSNLIPNSDEHENPNYIVCINETSQGDFAVVAAQPLTGEIIYDVFGDNVGREELETRLLYLRPSEVIVINKEAEICASTLKCLKLINQELKIEHKTVEPSVLNSYLNPSIVEFYRSNFPLSIQECISELLKYLAEFKLSNIFTIPQNLSTFKDSRKYMILPANTLNALEIFTNSTNPKSPKGTLVWLLNHTRTRFGDRLLHKWLSRPLIERDRIEERYQAVEDLSNQFNHVVDSLIKQLTKIGKNLDLEELLIKIHYSATTQSTRINRSQIFLMLQSFNDILKLVKSFEKTIMGSLNLKSPLLTTMLKDLLESSKTDIVYNFTNMINPAYLLNESRDPFEQKTKFFNLNYGFDDIKHEFEEIRNVEKLLDEELLKIRRLLQRPQLKYVTSNREPYLIEVRNGKQVGSLPASFSKINGTSTVSRFRSKEVSDLYKLKQYHEEMLVQKCDDAFVEFLQNIDSQYGFFQKIVKHLAVFDCLLSLTAISVLNTKVKPTLTDELGINVKNARHPIIEQLRDNYVGNDINIQYDSNRALIITGPNMGGKSSYVKMVALFTVMTQIGCYLPCESATMGIFDSIFIRMGASDNILKGNSTFMTEMLECANIIQHLTNRSLLILDEIGRGTGTTDGIALAYAILRYFIESEKKPLLLFITHYPSIHVLEHDYPGDVVNYHMGFEEIASKDQDFPEVIFLYNLCRGVVNSSYGLNVAKLSGIPNDVISEAYKVSEELKNKIEMEDNIHLLETLRMVLQQKTSMENIFKFLD
ncbi:MSH3 [Candida oxycetoniae]|uniref:DNA mismatch repair protein MSH3 n=1 Tax=Candida oxycetoniae TaxID=497107 RepID=A0AAI9WWV9_9ASCO|nr:MSH3 [Candida oxycetoniae]KAI3403129.2 MSH3 [Candida oxycetoniae]